MKSHHTKNSFAFLIEKSLLSKMCFLLPSYGKHKAPLGSFQQCRVFKIYRYNCFCPHLLNKSKYTNQTEINMLFNYYSFRILIIFSICIPSASITCCECLQNVLQESRMIAYGIFPISSRVLPSKLPHFCDNKLRPCSPI